MKLTFAAVAVVFAVFGLATSAVAQIAYNPTVIEFDSSDHLTACPATTCIDHYVVEYWIQGVDPAVGQPVSSATLPKAAVVATGSAPAYRALLTSLVPLMGIPIGQVYVARMRSVNTDPSYISDRSDPSNGFATAVAGTPIPPAGVRIIR